MDADTGEILYDIEIDENLLDAAQKSIDHQKAGSYSYMLVEKGKIFIT